MVTLSLDVGSPYAYLALERTPVVLRGVEVVVAPVLLGAMFRATGRVSWATTDRREPGMRDVEARAVAAGLPALRWPDPWPGDGLRAMRGLVHATRAGRGAAFARAAMRLAFAEGEDLSRADVLARAATAAGLEPAALLAATDDPGVKDELRARTDAALASGIVGVPTWTVGGEHLWGDDRLEELAARLGVGGAAA